MVPTCCIITQLKAPGEGILRRRRNTLNQPWEKWEFKPEAEKWLGWACIGCGPCNIAVCWMGIFLLWFIIWAPHLFVIWKGALSFSWFFFYCICFVVEEFMGIVAKYFHPRIAFDLESFNCWVVEVRNDTLQFTWMLLPWQVSFRLWGWHLLLSPKVSVEWSVDVIPPWHFGICRTWELQALSSGIMRQILHRGAGLHHIVGNNQICWAKGQQYQFLLYMVYYWNFRNKNRRNYQVSSSENCQVL